MRRLEEFQAKHSPPQKQGTNWGGVAGPVDARGRKRNFFGRQAAVRKCPSPF